MDDDAIAEYLRRPPEEVRLAELYPELPQPIPFAEACQQGPYFDDGEEDDRPEEERHLFYIAVAIPKPYGSLSTKFAVTEHHHRIVGEYYDAQERQREAEEACAADRWLKPPAPPPRAPEPEDVPPAGKMTPRQEEFCRNYALQPVAIRAAILAGYAESNADSYGPRLLKNPLVLDRIAALRAEKHIRYTLERETMHDKLEAVFFDALGGQNHAAAVAALRLQAVLGGFSLRPGPERAAAPKSAKARASAAVEMPGNAGVSPRQKPGKARTRRRKTPGKARESP